MMSGRLVLMLLLPLTGVVVACGGASRAAPQWTATSAPASPQAAAVGREATVGTGSEHAASRIFAAPAQQSVGTLPATANLDHWRQPKAPDKVPAASKTTQEPYREENGCILALDATVEPIPVYFPEPELTPIPVYFPPPKVCPVSGLAPR